VKAKTRFLRQFASTGNLLQAALAAKVGRRTVYEWLEADPSFVALKADAHEDALDRLEGEAYRRAHDGWLEPVYQGGIKVGSIRKKSEALLMFLLKGKKPEVYRERHEHTGKDGGPIALALVTTAKASLLEKLDRLATRANQSVGIGPTAPKDRA
jgi:hypothetical protein